MTIVPSSEVKILRGCKLKPDYKHSIWWVSATNQYNYFNRLTKHTVRQVQYLRSEGNAIKVPIPIESLIDCNYLMFTNGGHENKTYYAFIKNIEYVSESTTLIRYEIDLIQTWYFECTLMPCLVEREHSTTDEIGDNLRPEPVDTGNLVIDYSDYCSEVGNPAIFVASTFGVDNEGKFMFNYGDMYGKSYSGLCIQAVPANDKGVDFVRLCISLLSDNPLGEIVSIFMGPGICASPDTRTFTIPKWYKPFGSFRPNNNKLYTYPFNFLRVNAGDSSCKDYRYEFWGLDAFEKPTDIEFRLDPSVTCNPSVLLTPVGYRNQRCVDSSSKIYNSVEDTMVLTGFPQCPWSSDAFKAFLSQIASVAVSAVGAYVPAKAQEFHHQQYVALANSDDKDDRKAARAYGSSRSTVLEDTGMTVWSGLQAMFKPERSVKSVGGNEAIFNAGKLNFEFNRMRIDEESARLIDAFFDVYGYATDKVKVPNRSSRPQWNYVKTKDCCISASLPSDIVTKIQDIYNRGITFWCWGDNVGNYALDNKPK